MNNKIIYNRETNTKKYTKSDNFVRLTHFVDADMPAVSISVMFIHCQASVFVRLETHFIFLTYAEYIYIKQQRQQQQTKRKRENENKNKNKTKNKKLKTKNKHENKANMKIQT